MIIVYKKNLIYFSVLFVFTEKNNEVVVGPINALMQKKIVIKDINWLEKPKDGQEVMVKLRSSHKGSLAKIYSSKDTDKVYINLYDDHFGISPGQACVAYLGNQIIGGGWICDTE